MPRKNSLVAGLFTLCAAVLAHSAAAGEDYHTVQMFKFENDSGQLRTVRLDSNEMGFDLRELADGDSRTVTTADGQVVTLTRDGDTLAIGLDGESFDVPFNMHEHAGGADHVVKMARHHDAPDADSLLIVSTETIDDATREQIRAALAASGIDKEVRFADGDFDMQLHMEIDDAGQGANVVRKRIIRKTHTDN